MNTATTSKESQSSIFQFLLKISVTKKSPCPGGLLGNEQELLLPV